MQTSQQSNLCISLFVGELTQSPIWLYVHCTSHEESCISDVLGSAADVGVPRIKKVVLMVY